MPPPNDLAEAFVKLTEAEIRSVTGPALEVLAHKMEQRLEPILDQFQYGTLNVGTESKEIRLLELLPGNYTDTIRCRITVASIEVDPNQGPRYDALSYVWGEESSARRLIIIDDCHRGECKLMVTENLFFALRRLRLTSATRTLWVDAVSINQKDNEEKNVQVAMMRDIYARARQTFVWLGKASDNSDYALQLVPELIRAAEVDAPDNVKNLWALDDHQRVLPEAHEQIWYDLFKVLKRPWFYRAWIVQELAVSKHVVVLCGDVELEWKSLVRAIEYTTEAGGFGHSLGLTGLNQLWSLNNQRCHYQERQQTDVMQVLLENFRALATKPVDHIFAFHGFFGKGSFGHTLTRPRYEIECEQLYTQVAIELLQELENLDLFTITRVRETYSEQQVRDLPSWVPDWSAADLTEPFLWRNINSDFGPEYRVAYRASGDTSYSLVVQDGRKLKIEGWIVDEVNMTGLVRDLTSDQIILDDLPKFCNEIIKDQRTFRTWETVSGMFEWGSMYPTGEKRWDVYCRTLLSGCLYGSDYDHIAAIYTWWQVTLIPFKLLFTLRLDRVWFLWTFYLLSGAFFWLFADIFRLRFLRKYLEVSPTDGLFHKMMTNTAYRRMIRSDSGLIGLAPPLTQPEDMIVLCKGGKLPLILRPRGSDWELIGDCYIHGIMDGKLWDMLEGNCEANGSLWETCKEKCKPCAFWLV